MGGIVSRNLLLSGCAAGAIAFAGFAASPALAAGTAAGTVITNDVTVSYEVGGEEQDDATATNQITVDRKIDLTVDRVDDTATSVTPGADAQAVSFLVENLSNDTLDFELVAAQVTTGSAAGIAGNDSFDVSTPLTFYLDDGDNVFDETTPITHLNSLAPDTPVRVWVVADVPTGLANAAIASVTLTATAKENDNGAALGSNLTQSATNTAGEDTIFADGASGVAGDTARNAAFSAIDDFVVLTATLAAAKTSEVVAGDFATGAAIPGATVEYCIAVSNSGGTAATNINISDELPDEVTFVSAFGVLVGGADCDNPGANTGSEAGGIVSGSIASLAAGSTQTLIFRATID